MTNLKGNDKQSIANPDVTEQPTQNLSDIETEGSHTLYTVSQDVNYSDWSIDLNTNSHRILFKIDSGVQCNVLPKREYIHMSPRPKIKPISVKLTAYNGTDIPVLGHCVAHVKYKNKHTVPVLFIVADSKSTPILGLPTSEKLNLIKRVLMIEEFDDFQDVPQEIHEVNRYILQRVNPQVFRLFWRIRVLTM